MNTKNSRALKVAHILRKKAALIIPNSKLQVPQNWSQMLKLAWYFEDLRNWLYNGVVNFSYWKKDGEIRDALGTLCPLLIPAEDQPEGEASAEKGKPSTPSLSAIPYYDINKKAWRSFSVTNFIGFVTIYTLTEAKKEQASSTRNRPK